MGKTRENDKIKGFLADYQLKSVFLVYKTKKQWYILI